MNPFRRIILPILVSGFGTGCQNEELLEAKLQRVAEASRQIEILREEHQRSLGDSKEALEAARAEVRSIDERTEQALAATADARRSLEPIAVSFAEYRHQYRTQIRATITEKRFPEVVTPDGETLENLRVVSIENGVVRYRSRGGVGKFSMGALPDALVAALHINEEIADRAAFPTVALPRESDKNPEDDVIDLDALILLAQEKAETFEGRQDLRVRRAEAYKSLEQREKKLATAARSLSTQREALKAQRNRHKEYNSHHHVRERDPDIANIDASIKKIDLRALAVQKRISETRKLMQQLR